MELRFKTEGKTYDLEAFVKLVGSDLLVVIWGGQKPHIGAAAMAQPRSNLKDTNSKGESASVLCLPGHKDDIIAKAVAEKIATSLSLNVTVTTGIHWDHLDRDGINCIIDNSHALTEMIIDKFLKKDLK